MTSSIDFGIPGYGDVSELNRGGFATIYRAWQPTFEREVAIKVLSGQVDDAATERFRRECAAVGALSGHPNIVTVYEAGAIDDGRLFIVMELLHGGSLADQLSERGAFDVADVLDYGGRVTGAIESAHRAGILHRDLKPENILLSRMGEPKVADFGLAQLPGSLPSVTAGMTGTILHAAPEVLAGEPASVASDVYSLASTLFCLVSGRPPFAGGTDQSLVSLVSRVTSEAPPDLRSRGVPEELCLVLEQGLAKAPADRQHDVAQLGRQLQAVQACLGQPITQLPIDSAAPRPAASQPGPRTQTPTPGKSTPAPTAPTRRGRPRRLTIAGAAVLGVAAILSVVIPLTADRASPLPVLYQDNFDAGQNWYEHDDEIARLAYDEDRYRLVVKKAHEVVLSDTSFRGGTYGEPLTALTDVSVRVRAQAVSPAAIFGLFCRYGPSGDYYQAAVRTDGEALILKAEPPNVTTIARGRVAGLATGRDVRLRLDCTGADTTHVALFADDQRVAEAKDKGTLRYGSVGMLVSAEEPPADVLFEDFVLLGRRRQA